MSGATIIGLATAGTGVVAVMVAIYLGVQTSTRLRTWTRADAEVLKASVVSQTDSDGDRMFSPSYEVRVPSGDGMWVATIKSHFASNQENHVRAQVARHPAGSRMAVLINPAKPDQVMQAPASGGRPWTGSIAFAAIGYIFLLTGGILWFANQPREW